MKKRIITLAGLMALSCALAVGCGNSTSQTETQSAAQTEAASVPVFQKLLKHRYRPKKHRRRRVQQKRPQTQRQQKPLQHWKMELTRLILIQTAVCSRSMKCMMEKEL